MSLLEKHSDKVDTFVGVCHHLAAKQYVTGHGGNLAWKLEDNVILITPTKHNKGDVNRDNVVFINLAGETIEGSVKPTGETPMYVNFFRERPDVPVSYTHLRAHETKANLVCRLLLEKKK